MPDNDLTELATRVLATCRQQGLKLATVESCTGGLIAGALTAIAGSSDVVERGWVTYSNEAKMSEVGVPADLLQTHGAVSGPVARAMAEGALRSAPVDLAVSVTGIAGPGGGSADKPVGLVWMSAVRRNGRDLTRQHQFSGDRTAIRQQAVIAALELVTELTGADFST